LGCVINHPHDSNDSHKHNYLSGFSIDKTQIVHTRGGRMQDISSRASTYWKLMFLIQLRNKHMADILIIELYIILSL